VTATHLKRLFANQDVFNSLDRSVTGLTVSEADEKEIKPSESENTDVTSEDPTSAFSLDTTSQFSATPQLVLENQDALTPLAGILSPTKNPLSEPPTPRDCDSDSTISAPRHHSPTRSAELVTDRVDSSEMDSDVHDFASRLPRRSVPAPR